MSKRLYYSSCSLAAPHIGVVIDDILASKEEGDEIFWAYCNCALSSCFMNLDGHKSICQLCHHMYKEYQQIYGAGVHIMPIKRENINKQERSFDFKDAEELKAFTYRQVEVGNSILSLYYTVTRDLDMDKFNQFHVFALPLVNQLCDLIDKAYEIIAQALMRKGLINGSKEFQEEMTKAYKEYNVIALPKM